MLYHYSTSPHYLRMYSSFRGWTSHRPLHWSSDSPQSVCHEASRDPLTQHKHPWKFTRHASLIFTSAFRPNSLWWCEILSVRDVNQAWEITHEALIFFLSLSVIVTNGSNWNSSGRTRFHLAAVMNWLRSDSTCIQKNTSEICADESSAKPLWWSKCISGCSTQCFTLCYMRRGSA